MSRTYLFFTPAELPLTTEMVSDRTVLSFTDQASVQAILETHLPELEWRPALEHALAVGTVTDDGAIYEFYVAHAPEGTAPPGAPTLIVSLRSSGRVDSESFVQRLVDATGWVAFDDRPRCFQPYQPPMPA
jgi:hypothetical protein